MSQLITRRWSVTNVPPALATSTAPPVSAPLIREPTPLAEANSTVSQVPVSLTSSVSVESLSARRPHRRRRDPEPSNQTSSASRVEFFREGARTCTCHTDVRPPNLATSILSCSTFDLRANSPCRYPVA
ncbi:unnamed protein product [Malus baccata var. baccata]